MVYLLLHELSFNVCGDATKKNKAQQQVREPQVNVLYVASAVSLFC